MNEKELVKAANNGDVSAIEEYADYLIRNEKYTESQEWFLRGANAGSYYCMIKYAHLTIALVESSINIISGEAVNGIKNLIEAEKWAKIARDAGKLGDDNVLGGTHGLYSEMTWCYYLVALKTKQIDYYRAIIEKYNLINEKPSSRTTYAFIQALEEFGEYEKAFDTAALLVKDYDNTLKDFMLEILYAALSKAYFEGKFVPADYNLAYENVKLAGKYNPDCELLGYFNSGAAKRDFDAAHSKDSLNSSGGSKGCYVATAIYGSYDCPEVWTLRRFRDSVLESSWYGRAFIKVYYAISPKLVKFFGNRKWFNQICKNRLDVLVQNLKNKGIEDTKYYD